MNNRMKTCAKWTADENEMFIKVIDKYGLNWSELKAHLPHRSLTQLKTHANNLKRRYKENKQYFIIKKYPRKRVALQHERIEAEKASLLFTKLFPNKRSNKSRLAELKELHEVIRIIDNVRSYKTETANTNEDNICNNNCNCNCNDCSCTVLSSLLLMSYIYYIYDYLSVYMYLEMYLHRRNKALALSLCSFIITYSALSKLCNDMFSFV